MLRGKPLKKALKHNKRRYLCGCCDWIKQDKKWDKGKLKGIKREVWVDKDLREKNKAKIQAVLK